MNNNVQIIIPTWNALSFTKLTLDSLFEYTGHPYHLTIVDNASADGTVDYLKEVEARLKFSRPESMIGYNFMYNTENTGYAGGNIQGWNSIKADNFRWSCLCNNDLVFSPNWLSRMTKIMQADPEIGIMGSMRPAPFVQHPFTKENTSELNMRKLLKDTYSTNRDPKSELMAFTQGMDWENFTIAIEATNYQQPWEITAPPGFVMTCCAIVDRQAAEAVGGVFREDWGLYGADDVDLSWRIVKEGGRKAAMAPVYVHHHVHAACDSGNFDKEIALKEGDLRLYRIWEDEIKAILRRKIAENPNFRDEVMTDVNNYPEWFMFLILENVVGKEEFWRGVEGSADKEIKFGLHPLESFVPVRSKER